MYENLRRYVNFKYTLSDLQRLYGREESDVSSNMSIKRFKIRKSWQEEAIRFINEAYPQIGALTLRQIHYQLVGLPDYENTIKYYNKLVVFLLKARLAGLVKWHMISETETEWFYPIIEGVRDVDEAVELALKSIPPMGVNPWDEIGRHVYVFTEKRGLFEQLYKICKNYYVPLVCFKGYGAVWTRLYYLAPKMKEAVEKGCKIHILVMSDHDPSGLDINRFYLSVLKNYYGFDIREQRVALTAKQIIDLNLPPNPAKVKDPRFKWYNKAFGDKSWEIDALVKGKVKRMQEMLENAILDVIGDDKKTWFDVVSENKKLEEEAKKRLQEMKEK